MPGKAREDRGRGNPLNDAERAARHYNIPEEEYLADPDAYPLPARGTGLTSGSGFANGVLVLGLVFGVSAAIALAVNRKKI